MKGGERRRQGELMKGAVHVSCLPAGREVLDEGKGSIRDGRLTEGRD